MQIPKADRPTRTAPDARAAQSASSSTSRRAIDCGAADDRASRVRAQDRAASRHAFLSSRGSYLEQPQAI